MHPNGIPELFQKIEKQFNLSENQLDFISKCKLAYSSGTLSDGFRKLLHEYFGNEGLVILDADSHELKISVTNVLLDELSEKNEDALKKSSADLASAGYAPQLVVRGTNLFWISEAGREKIKLDGDQNVTKGEIALCSSLTRTNWVKEQAYNLSPNAALRPLYQEFILPNLVYVGGGSELKYWHQLLGLFQNYQKQLPILHLRTSNIIIPDAKLKAISFARVDDLFKSDNELVSAFGQDLAKVLNMLENRKLEVESSLKDYDKIFSDNIPGKSIATRIQKILQRLEELHNYTKSEVSQNGERNVKLDKVLRTKNMYANPSSIQERNEHIVGFADILDDLVANGYSHFGLKNSQKISVIVSENV